MDKKFNAKTLETYLNSHKKVQYALLVIGGLFVGLANGFFGGGGGMIVVPLFTYIACMEEKNSHATAVCTILPLSIASGIVYIINKNFDLNMALTVGAGTIVGGLVGVYLLKKLSNDIISIIFYCLMLGVGIKMAIV